MSDNPRLDGLLSIGRNSGPIFAVCRPKFSKLSTHTGPLISVLTHCNRQLHGVATRADTIPLPQSIALGYIDFHAVYTM